MKINITDDREPPFAWQSREALAAIVGLPRRAVAPSLALYAALTHVGAGRDTFIATYRRVADASGLATSTVKKYAPALEDLGLIHRADAPGRSATNWSLTNSRAAANDADTNGRAAAIEPDQWPRGGQSHPRAGETSSKKASSCKASEISEVGSNAEREESRSARARVRVGGRAVAGEHWELTERVLAELNTQTGRHYRLLRADEEPSQAATYIYKRIREYRDLTFEDHKRIITNTIASKWWGLERASFNVIYGPRVFESNISRRGSGRHRDVGTNVTISMDALTARREAEDAARAARRKQP